MIKVDFLPNKRWTLAWVSNGILNSGPLKVPACTELKMIMYFAVISFKYSQP
jgi:hypothetical protein